MIVLDEDAVHVVAACPDGETVLAVRPELEALVVDRCGVGTDQIARERAEVVQQDVRLLVRIRVDRDPALLHHHAAIVLRRVERIASEVTFHGRLSSLSLKHNADVHARRRELFEPRAQVVPALRLKQIVEDAHFGLVLRAAADFSRARSSQLRVPRVAVSNTGELRPHAQPLARNRGLLRRLIEPAGLDRLLDAVGLTPIPSRRPAAGRDVAEPHAPKLAPGYVQASIEDGVVGHDNRVNVHDAEHGAALNRQTRMRHRLARRSDRFTLQAGRVNDAVGDAQRDRIDVDLVFLYDNRADDAVLDADRGSQVDDLETRLGPGASAGSQR